MGTLGPTSNRSRRGTGMIFCIGLIAVLAIALQGQLNAFVYARQAQRNAEVARAERLLEANARVLLDAIARSPEPSDPPLSERILPLSIELQWDAASQGLGGTLLARGGHPAARVAIHFQIAPGDSLAPRTFTLRRIPYPAND